MKNPWLDFPTKAPFVAECDAPFIARYNATAKDIHYLHTEVMPAPFNGGLDSARLVVLILNPGYDPKDEFRTEEYRQAIRENFASPREYKDFVYMKPKFSKVEVKGRLEDDAGYSWWTPRWREVTEICGPVGGKIMALEWFPYPSTKFKEPKELFPSQQFTFELLREAMRQKKPILITRKKRVWIQSVPELADYPYVFELNSCQNVYVSRKNVKDGRFNEIVDILKD